MEEYTQVRLPKSLVNRLKLLARPHQALAGVIEDLLTIRELNIPIKQQIAEDNIPQ
jgi:gamma-glutamyl phosphate reductase